MNEKQSSKIHNNNLSYDSLEVINNSSTSITTENTNTHKICDTLNNHSNISQSIYNDSNPNSNNSVSKIYKLINLLLANIHKIENEFPWNEFLFFLMWSFLLFTYFINK